MDKKIKEILKYAVMAPSGDNSQPWRFVLQSGILRIYNLPGKDNPYLNFKQSGSLIAHGALIKNIEIASSSFNLVPLIKLLPSKEDLNLVAEVSFKESGAVLTEDVLFKFIPVRSTNRRPYDFKELSDKDKVLLNEAGVFDDTVLRFITDTEKIKKAARAGSNAEIIILENKLLHSLLFKDVMWSKKQENKEKHGLYIKTMEFNPIQKFLFRLASNKRLMRLAVKIKFPHFIAKEDAFLYSSGSTMGLLSTKKASLENFIKLGMKMQYIWVKATSLGLSFQPITATLFLGFKLRNNPNDSELSLEHKKMSLSSYKDIFSAFDINQEEIPLMMFRIGYAKTPSARSSRKDPLIDLA